MKKVTLILAALALVLGLSQCNKEKTPALNGEKQHIVLNASFANGNSKIDQDGIGLKWTVNDQIDVFQDNENIGSLQCTDATNGIFEGDINETSGNIIFTFGEENYMSQTGELNAALHLTSGEVAYADDGNYNVTMTTENAVLKLDLSNYGGTGSGNTVTISDGTSVVASVADVTSGSTAFYVAVPANGIQRTYFIEGNSYVSVKIWTLESNKFYTKQGESGPTGEAIVIEPDWINFNDATMNVSGLPMWALKNIGATNGSTPESWYGNYYAWGEITTKTDYSWETYKYADGSFTRLTKYCNTDNLTMLENSDDAAIFNWGSPWRMPTKDDWENLEMNAYFKWEFNYKGIPNLNGLVVYKVKDIAHKGLRTVDLNHGEGGVDWATLNYDLEVVSFNPKLYSISDPHLFFPAAGRYDETLLNGPNYGYYWSSSLSSPPKQACSSYFYKCDVNFSSTENRSSGYTVRPVRNN